MRSRGFVIKKETVQLGLVLFFIVSIVTGILAIVHAISFSLINERRIEFAEEMRRDVLPEAEYLKRVEREFQSSLYPYVPVTEVYEGVKGEERVGYVVKTLPEGYGGTIEVVVGFAGDNIIAVMTGNATRVPRVDPSFKTLSFQELFSKKTFEELIVVTSGSSSNVDVLAISGATINSTAVHSGISAALDIYNTQLRDKESFLK